MCSHNLFFGGHIMYNNDETIRRLFQYSTTFSSALENFANNTDQAENVAVMMNAINRVYNVISEVTVDLSCTQNGWENTEQIGDASSRDVSIKVTDDMLIVRVPNLASKFSSFSRAHAADYSTMYASDVRRLMMKQDLSGLDLTFKHISVISVYDSKTQKIPDADNLDTKAIVDAITRYLPGGDDWAHCSFSSANIKSETIKPGTYFILSPNYLEPPSMTDLTRKLESGLDKERYKKMIQQCCFIP